MTFVGITGRSIKRYILITNSVIDPFELPARDLPVLNKTIFEYQEEIFSHLRIQGKPLFISSLDEITPSPSEMLIYRDDTYFNEELVLKFIKKALTIKESSRLAFLDSDPCISTHACYPQYTLQREGILFLGEFYYIPAGANVRNFIPIIIDTESVPLSCFSLPLPKLGFKQKLLNNPLSTGQISFPPMQFQVPRICYITIKHWTHLLFANFIWGIHCQSRQRGIGFEYWNISMLLRILPHLSKRRGLIQIGKGCQIDSTAIIIGPTTIGDGVVIGPNVTIAVGNIGNHAVLEPNCTVWLGVLGERSSLLANRSLILSCVMGDSIINTDVRFSIVGNHSFLAGGSYLSDRLLSHTDEGDPWMNAPMVKVLAGEEIVNSGYYILGPAIGNRVRIGSGVIIYPGRMINSGSLILPEQGPLIVNK
jgi:UDP-N-acetylglucosamine diphosphorylase / glucose-1-phosphate thymidylyltransferase / UDP-N-acetylgalactosamine diphosphorylase / glucosamine-1-phosphate N-acetyltransferase / galactosamine-1-phosphate N-acetyltransferase